MQVGRTALMIASTNGSSDVVRLLLAHDAEVNATDNVRRLCQRTQFTVHSVQGFRGWWQAWEFSLKIHVQDGNTALILSAKARHLTVNEVLIASGAAVYAVDNVRVVCLQCCVAVV